MRASGAGHALPKREVGPDFSEPVLTRNRSQDGRFDPITSICFEFKKGRKVPERETGGIAVHGYSIKPGLGRTPGWVILLRRPNLSGSRSCTTGSSCVLSSVTSTRLFLTAESGTSPAPDGSCGARSVARGRRCGDEHLGKIGVDNDRTGLRSGYPKRYHNCNRGTRPASREQRRCRESDTRDRNPAVQRRQPAWTRPWPPLTPRRERRLTG